MFGLLEIVSQGAIFIGALSVFLLGKGSRWGFVMGLAVQPFWYFTAINHGQWGLVAASIVYTYGWVMGVYRTFYKKQPVTEKAAE
jgi:hypothetical protein